MTSSRSLATRFSFYPGLNIEGDRASRADELLCDAIEKLQACAAGSTEPFDWVSSVKYRFEVMSQLGLTSKGLVRFNPKGLTEWTIVHELAHAWDASLDWQLSKRMRKATHSYFLCRWLHKRFPEDPRFWYHVGSPPPPCGAARNFNEKEDFAEADTAYLFPEEAHRRALKRNASYEAHGFSHFHATPRGKFIAELFNKNSGNS
jgi:hypothetical protein